MASLYSSLMANAMDHHRNLNENNSKPYTMLITSSIFLFGLLQVNQVSSLILTPTQQCILTDFSWKVKVKFFNNLLSPRVTRRDPSIQSLVLSNSKGNNFNNADTKERHVDIQLMTLRRNNVRLANQLKRNVAIDFLVKPRKNTKKSQRIDNNESSVSMEEKAESNNIDFEAMGVHDGLLTDHNSEFNKNKYKYRRQDSPEVVSHKADEEETERDMKLKLFRLMYDTVKDNDELVRKADEIKKEHDHTSVFEIGFIMGAITDKVNTMSEIALTVERLYDTWKPIEHVNAYEQIANHAIEINHLVDVLQSAHKKSAATAKPEEKPAERKENKNFKHLRDLSDLQELNDAKPIIRRNIDRTF